jgi:hypothetical protein
MEREQRVRQSRHASLQQYSYIKVNEHHGARQVFWQCQNTCTTAPLYTRYGIAISSTINRIWYKFYFGEDGTS